MKKVRHLTTKKHLELKSGKSYKFDAEDSLPESLLDYKNLDTASLVNRYPSNNLVTGHMDKPRAYYRNRPGLYGGNPSDAEDEGDYDNEA